MHSRVLVSLRVLAGVALAGTCLWGQSLMAQNIVVGNCTNSSKSYATIQEAVDHAASGSTVLVCPGTYPEQVEISAPLTLAGISSNNTDAVVITPPAGGVSTNATVYLPKPPSVQPVINSPAAPQIWVHDTTRVTLSNLTVDGTGNGISSDSDNCNWLMGIYLQNVNGTVKNVLTRNQETGGCSSGFGALVESDSNLTSTVTVRDSIFRSWDGFGFWAEGSGTKVRFQSNSVEGPGLSTGVNDVTYERATGTIDGNSLIDALTEGPTATNLTTASCGIALTQTGSAHVTVSGNVIGNTQCGIAIYDSDGDTISSNIIFGTHANDGVYVCGNGNVLRGNTISDSDRAGIFLSCADVSSLFPGATVNNNKISDNTINGAGIGVLFQIQTAGNRLKNNRFFNVNQVVVHLVGIF